jgi:cardiolipin synthase
VPARMLGAVASGGDRRILTVPNVVTVVRLSCLPLFLWLLFGRDDRASAAWLLGALGATDWVDGFVARRFGQVSELGKVLDPTADRLLFLVGVGGIVADGSAPLWFALAVLVREGVLGIVLVGLTLAGMQRFDVTWWGKAATFALMWTFPFFLMGNAGSGLWFGFCATAAWVVGVPGLVLSWWSAAQYVPTIRRSLADGRADRAGRAGVA